MWLLLRGQWTVFVCLLVLVSGSQWRSSSGHGGSSFEVHNLAGRTMFVVKSQPLRVCGWRHEQCRRRRFQSAASTRDDTVASEKDDRKKDEDYKKNRKERYAKMARSYDEGGGTVNSNLLKRLNDSFDYQDRILFDSRKFRCGFVGILGSPNVGKSTLVNALLDQDLVSATPLPQTTRHAIRAVLTSETTQLCFMDTPGVMDKPNYLLQEKMMDAVRSTVRDAELLLVVTDIAGTMPSSALSSSSSERDDPNDQKPPNPFQSVFSSPKPKIVLINKVDMATDRIMVERAILEWRQRLPDAFAILPLCALAGSQDVGVSLLRHILLANDNHDDDADNDDALSYAIRQLGKPYPGMFANDQLFVTAAQARSLLPESPPLYDPETLTDRSERFFASEIIRAALFRSLDKEIPYCCEVRIQEFWDPQDPAFAEMFPNKKDDRIGIVAVVVVERESQQRIVIGKGGSKIKQVGMEARTELQEFLQAKVHLELTVKVEKDWRKDKDKLKAYGYMS